MPRRSRLLRSAPTIALALPAALALLAAACTSAADDAPPAGDTSEASTPHGWMLSSGHVFGQRLVATGQGSLLRAMDARNGKIRVLATDPRGLGGTVWAPDGLLLASLNPRGAWAFVDGEGHRATEVPVDNEVPFGWGT
jgi:hypothetical protein